MRKLDLNLDSSELSEVAKALASQIRVDILKKLNTGSFNVLELAEFLKIPVSTAAFNIKILENADLIRVKVQPSTRGVMKLCSRKLDKIDISLEKLFADSYKTKYISMPIGHYTSVKAEEVCGLASEQSIIGTEDSARSFYAEDRFSAQIVWFSNGYLEYKFPSLGLENCEIKSLQISMEVCSEAPNFCEDYPSDITLFLNNSEIATYTCPGDFGARRGKLNPEWWPSHASQYGILKKWRIDDKGTFLDENKVSDDNIDMLKLTEKEFILLRVGIKEDAKNKGGMNLFGRKFGDYSQDINMRIDYLERK